MATSTPPANHTEESYTAMDTADLDAIGRHCEFPYCHQLDFLPFRCDSCHHTYCLEHRTETAHKCAHAGEWARNRRKNSVNKTLSSTTGPLSQKPTLATATQCSETSCKTFINTTQNQAVHCPNCNRNYCLRHRFRESHDCANLTPLGARLGGGALSKTTSNTEKVRLGFARLKTWSREKQDTLKPKPKPTSPAAQLASLNALKRDAKGDPNLSSDKRIYLHVEAEAASTTAKLPRAPLYFNGDWSVGKVLDDAARRLQVANVNNRVEDEEARLRVYHVEQGRLLGFGEKLNQSGVRSGNTLVLLRGVGAG